MILFMKMEYELRIGFSCLIKQFLCKGVAEVEEGSRFLCLSQANRLTKNSVLIQFTSKTKYEFTHTCM